jgi:membrane protease YdiL (CAAX protease family)
MSAEAVPTEIEPSLARTPPWSGAEVLVVFLFVYLFWPLLVVEGLRVTHFFAHVYGEDLMQQAHARDDNPAHKLAGARVDMWLTVLSLPLQVASVPLLLRARPAQVGLTWLHGGANLRLGFLATLVLTPVVLGIHIGVTALHQTLLHQPVEQHPLTGLWQAIRSWEWVVFVLNAAVAAPVLEELLFRGLLQPWFAGRPAGGLQATGFALLMAVAFRYNRLTQVWGEDWGKVLLELAPAIFVLVMGAVVVLLERHCRTPVPAGIFGTALLFAAAHSGVWPSPVPLLVLGLGLGWLAHRTGSLVAPIVVHALFNGVACVFLWLGLN